MTRGTRNLILQAGVAACMVMPLHVAAQQEGAGQRTLDEVVVTAQRRQQDVQDIPVAVSAFDSDQLARLGVREAFDLTRLVPNFIGNNNVGLGTANTYSIRGLNNTESIATFDPPVGSYVDDIYVSRQNANNFTFFDVDRIEVLRGPQGTLFGRNTTGGAVNVIMKRPAEEFGGFVEAGVGRYSRRVLRGAVDIPVSERVLTKVSAYWIDDDGFLENRTTGETLSYEENYGVRADLTLLLSDSVTWDLSMDYTDTERDAITGEWDGSGPFTLTGLRKGATLEGLVSLRSGKDTIPYGNRVKAFALTSRLNMETQFGDLEFITGWRSMNQKFLLDFFNGPGPGGGFTLANDGDHDQFSQEIKLVGEAFNDRLDYVLGFYYIDEDNETDLADVFGGFLVLADRLIENTTEAWAIYGQADYRFAGNWVATVGMRYTDEKKDIRYDSGAFDTSDILALGIPVEQRTQLWTPRVALAYEFNDDVSMYVSATRGFKSGGWNARGTLPERISPFGPEIAWSYEVGLRSEWLDRRVRANVTAFSTDVSGFQLPTAIREETSIQFLTRNVADLEARGLELELAALPTERLSVFANLGFQDSKYRNLSPLILDQQQRCLAGEVANCGNGIITLQGEVAKPTRAPTYTAALGADYIQPLSPQLELVPGIAVTRYGRHFISTNNDGRGRNPGYSHVRASVSLQDTSGMWSVRVDCDNCTNRAQLGSVFAGLPYFNSPRTWLASFRYNF